MQKSRKIKNANQYNGYNKRVSEITLHFTLALIALLGNMGCDL